jgi:hypothetical protein
MPTLMGAPDLLARLKQPDAYRFFKSAKEARRSLSAQIDQIIDIDEADRKAGVDGFGVLMAEADIVTRSMPEQGIYADTVEDFLDRGGRALFVEWGWRQYRRAQAFVRPSSFGQRASTSLDMVLGSPMRPFADDTQIIMDDFQPAIPVAEVLSANRGITGNAFRKMILTEPTAAQKRFVRVGELGEIPKTTITVGTALVNVYKFARGLEISDEAMRRESLDRIATMIQLIAVQNDIDKLAAIIDVMVNGDEGGGNAATSYNLTTLDSTTTANILTPTAWYAFRNKWANPYQMTHALMTEAVATKLQLLTTGSANLPLSMLPAGLGLSPQLSPINPNLSNTIRFGITSDAPASKILAFDRRVTAERLFEVGAETQETERYVSRQSEAVFFSEVEGYIIRSKNGARILNLAA